MGEGNEDGKVFFLPGRQDGLWEEFYYYRVGQKIPSGFSVRFSEKPERTFCPIQYLCGKAQDSITKMV